MAHWTLQLSGRVDADVEDGQIVRRHSDRKARAREAELIDQLRELVAVLGCDYARLCTEHHGNVDLVT